MQNKNIFLTLGLKTSQYFRNEKRCRNEPGNCQMPGCCVRSFVNCSCRFAARDVLKKVHLQECFTANNSKTKQDIDVISAPQCVTV